MTVKTEPEKVVLTDGMTLDVPERFLHRMTALEDTEIVELYWAKKLESTDIVRFTDGGVNNLDLKSVFTEEEIRKINDEYYAEYIKKGK